MGKKPFYSFAQDVYAFPIVRLNIVDVFSTLIYVRTQFLCGFLTVILEGAWACDLTTSTQTSGAPRTKKQKELKKHFIEWHFWVAGHD